MVTPETSALGILAVIALWLFVANIIIELTKEAQDVRHSRKCRLAGSSRTSGTNSP